MGYWQEVEHTADLALHLWATDLADLFTTAARGMFAFMAVEETTAPVHTVAVQLTATDVETLLIDWLNELLYWAEITSLVFTTYTFEQLTTTQLVATAHGYPVREYRNYIKAATFHELAVVKTPQGYETKIVFDM